MPTWRGASRTQGYLAIAPELFVRQGDAGSYVEVAKLIAEVVSRARDAQVLADLDACVAWAATQGGDIRRLGITGFCWGGRIVWMYAAHNPALTAGVAWYGPVARAYAAGDKTAIELAPRIKAPMLGLYGADDAGIPTDTLEQMRAALKAAGNTRSEIVLYPDTPHAFYADYRPNYRKDAGRRRLAPLPGLVQSARRGVILAYIVIATLAGGLLSVLIAAALTVHVLGRVVKSLVSLSVGVLLGTALLLILPEAFEGSAAPQPLFATLLLGLLFFFLLEKAELYRHGHHHEGDDPQHHHQHGFDAEQAGRGGWAVLVGDSIHNFCDGIIIAAAFLADVRLGMVTALAIIAHEIPQEVGDYVVLLNAGLSRGRALAYNAISGLAAVVGGVVGYFVVGPWQALFPVPAGGGGEQLHLCRGGRPAAAVAASPAVARNAGADRLDRLRPGGRRGDAGGAQPLSDASARQR